MKILSLLLVAPTLYERRILRSKGRLESGPESLKPFADCRCHSVWIGLDWTNWVDMGKDKISRFNLCSRFKKLRNFKSQWEEHFKVLECNYEVEDASTTKSTSQWIPNLKISSDFFVLTSSKQLFLETYRTYRNSLNYKVRFVWTGFELNRFGGVKCWPLLL